MHRVALGHIHPCDFPSRHIGYRGAMTSQQPHDEPQAPAARPQKGESWKDELPNFMQNYTKVDWFLYGALMLTAVYGFAVIPFRATLLVNHTMLYTVLTGSNLSVLAHAAQNPDRTGFLAFVVAIAALSAIKFLPIFYFAGKRWGPDFLDASFAGHPPRWFKKIEGFIHRHIGISMALAYVPFSPIAATIIAIVGGLSKVRAWVVFAYAYVFACMLKLFYVYLGITFGEEVKDTLQVIDRYITWITLALLAYMFAAIYYKQKKKR